MLFDLPAPADIRHKYDSAGGVADHRVSIFSAAEAVLPAPASPYEIYMASRICGGSGQRAGWLDDIGVATVSNLCFALGLTLSHKSRSRAGMLTQVELMTASELGFLALREGPDGLHAAMREAQDGPSGGGMGFMHDFMPFHRYLTRMDLADGSERVRDAVRCYIIANYPTGTGEAVLGLQTTQRALHSPLSASTTANVSRARLCSALRAIRQTGAFPHLPRPTKQLWIPCGEWDPWLKTYGETVIFKEAAPRIGASPATLQKVVDAGWLKPFVDFPKQVPRFHPSDLEQFVDRMIGSALQVDSLDETMVPIDRAPLIFKVQLVDLLRLIWEKRLRKVHSQAGCFGLRSIILDLEEVRDFYERPDIEGWSIDDARHFLHVCSSTMTLLIRERMINFIRLPHHRTRQLKRYIIPEAMADFLSRYETLGRLAHFEHVQAKSVQARLNRLQIDALPLPSPHSKIYRRPDLAPYLG
ncbi:hypothetical protein [Paracoccus rhizosphaerae]|nr:hypothetical protein [Paracoccus rhizosphaerae]